eukprot:scaffold40761_cov153-Skeletonema_marinoi.AAC.1
MMTLHFLHADVGMPALVLRIVSARVSMAEIPRYNRHGNPVLKISLQLLLLLGKASNVGEAAVSMLWCLTQMFRATPQP